MKSCKRVLIFLWSFVILSNPVYSQEVLEYLGVIAPNEKDFLKEPSSIFVEKERIIIEEFRKQ